MAFLLLCLMFFSQTSFAQIESLDFGNCWAEWQGKGPLQLRLAHFGAGKVLTKELALHPQGEQEMLWCSSGHAFVTQVVVENNLPYCWRWDLLAGQTTPYREELSAFPEQSGCLGHRAGELLLWLKTSAAEQLKKNLSDGLNLERVSGEQYLLSWDDPTLHTLVVYREIKKILEKKHFPHLLEFQQIFLPVGEKRAMHLR